MSRRARHAGAPEGGRLVFGIQPVRELLRVQGPEVAGLWVAADSDNPKLESLCNLARSRGVEPAAVSRGELDRRTKGAMHQGVVAEGPPLTLLDEDELLALVDRDPARVVTLLDGIMDPQNFGALVRSAVALASAEGAGRPEGPVEPGGPGGVVVFPEHGAAPLSPATFRASAGAIEHATLVRVPSLPPLIEALKQRGFTVVLLEGRAEHELDRLPLTGPTAIVVGAEDRGARPAVRKAVSARARLPMSPAIDSLNASVATALALYEVARQRRHVG